MSSLVIQAHCNGDPKVTQKEIDLAYGTYNFDNQLYVFKLVMQ